MDALLIDKDEYVLRFVGKPLYRFFKDDLIMLVDLLKEYNRCQIMPKIPNMYEVSREDYPKDAPWPQPPWKYRMYINGNWILAEHSAHLTLARKAKEWMPDADGLPRCHKEVRQLFSMNRLAPHPEQLSLNLEAWVFNVLQIPRSTDLGLWMHRRGYGIGDTYIRFYPEPEW